MDEQLARSFDYCRDLTRREARNFYYGMKLTPEPKRSAMYAVYAWMRTADDLADDSHDPRKVEAFAALTDRALAGEAINGDGQLHGDMWPAVCHTFRGYPVKGEHLHAMIAGQRSDLKKQHIATFEDLRQYCYRVASVVGLICVAIWGDDGDARVTTWAEQRGVAFQLTNILRDLREDAQRGRVYLPAEDLARFGYSCDDLKAGKANDAFDALMTFQIERARQFYEDSAALDEHLSADCRATSRTLCRIYRALLERIAADPRKVLTGRVSVPAVRKLAISLRGKWSR